VGQELREVLPTLLVAYDERIVEQQGDDGEHPLVGIAMNPNLWVGQGKLIALSHIWGGSAGQPLGMAADMARCLRGACRVFVESKGGQPRATTEWLPTSCRLALARACVHSYLTLRAPRFWLCSNHPARERPAPGSLRLLDSPSGNGFGVG
jgi:hypothetical protein